MVVQEIKEIQQILQLKFSLLISWVDARLDFYNIKLDETMNVISSDELNKIWLPIIGVGDACFFNDATFSNS